MSADIKIKMETTTNVVKADIKVTHQLGDFERWFLYGISVLLFALVVTLSSCSAPIHIQPPVSMEMWTDHPDEGDPLEACQRITGETREGTCVVMTARALVWWMAQWTACEDELDAREGK